MSKIGKKTKAALAAALVLCLAGAVLPAARNAGNRQTEETETPAAASAPAPSEEGTAPALPRLSDSQNQLLAQLSEAMERGDLEQAARLMLEEETALGDLFYETLEGNRYLYQEGELSPDPDGTGLVLARPTVLFYGTFAGGVPQGQASALQATQLEYPRYDYSAGSWEDGRMEGEGRTGYCYYAGAGEENQSVSREGVFSGDLMEGAVRYVTVNAEGEESAWTMEAREGKLVLTDAWEYQENDGTYRLPSEGDSGHDYVISEENAEETRFQNMIPWD